MSALVMVNARYILPIDRYTAENIRSDMRYGATREGVKIYEKPQSENMDDKDFLKYISSRRGVATDGYFDGLFGAFGKADLEAETQRLAQHPDSIEWRLVISLKKEDADRMNIQTIEDWRRILNRNILEIGKQLGISPKNLVWNAAFHPIDKNGSDHHPHVHVYLYSTDAGEGVAGDKEHTAEALGKCRSILTNDIFHDDISEIKAARYQARKELERAAAIFAESREEAIREIMRDVEAVVPAKGRLAYGYLPAKSKLVVDEAVSRLCSVPGLSEHYKTLYSAVLQQTENYYEDPQKVQQQMARWRSDFFHPTKRKGMPGTVRAALHNAVLRAAAANISQSNTEYERHTAPEVGPSIVLSDMDEFEKQLLLQTAPLHYDEDFTRSFFGLDESDNSAKSLAKSVYKEALYSIRQEIYGIMHGEHSKYLDRDFAARLIDEVRLDVPSDETYSREEDLINDDVIRQCDILSEETRNDIGYITKVLTHDKKASYFAVSSIQKQLTDLALISRFRRLLREHMDQLDFTELRALTGDKRYNLNSCGEDIQAAAKKIGAQLLLHSEELVNAWSHSINVDLTMNGILAEAYYLNLSEQVGNIYAAAVDHDEKYCYLAEHIPLASEYHNLPLEVQQVADSLLPDWGDNKATDIFKKAVLNISNERRLKLLLAENPALGDRIIEAAAPIRQSREDTESRSYSGLTDKEKEAFQKALEPLLTQHAELAEYFKTGPDACAQKLWRVYYDKTSELVSQMYADIPQRSKEYKALAAVIPCTAEYGKLQPDVKRRIDALLPNWGDEEAKNIFRFAALNITAGERVKQIVSDNRDISAGLLRDTKNLRAFCKERQDSSYSSFSDEMKAEFKAVTARAIRTNPELSAYFDKDPDTCCRQMWQSVGQAEYEHRQQFKLGLHMAGSLLSMITSVSARQQQQGYIQDQQQERRRKKRRKEEEKKQAELEY